MSYRTRLLINTLLMIAALVAAFLAYDAIVPTEITQ
jgi:hypothetical protein